MTDIAWSSWAQRIDLQLTGRFGFAPESAKTAVRFEIFPDFGNDPGEEEAQEAFSFAHKNGDAITGTIKWDGCANLDLPTHYCGFAKVLHMHTALIWAYDEAKRLMREAETWLE